MDDYLFDSPELLEGIGPAHAKALAGGGIATIGDLLRRDDVAVERLVRTSLEQVRGWQAAGRLLRVDGVDPDIAEALAAGGIASATDLARTPRSSVEAALAAAVAARRLPAVPDAAALDALLQDAARKSGTGMVFGALHDTEGTPLEGTEVVLDDRSTKADAAGRFTHAAAPAGLSPLRVVLEGRPDYLTRVAVTSERVAPRLDIHLSPGADVTEPAVVDERDGKIVTLSSRGRVRVVTRDLSDVPDDTFLLLHDFGRGGKARLLHLYRRRVGWDVEVDRIWVEPEQLPEGAAIDDVLLYEGGLLSRSGSSEREVALLKLQRVLGEPVEPVIENVDWPIDELARFQGA